MVEEPQRGSEREVEKEENVVVEKEQVAGVGGIRRSKRGQADQQGGTRKKGRREVHAAQVSSEEGRKGAQDFQETDVAAGRQVKAGRRSSDTDRQVKGVRHQSGKQGKVQQQQGRGRQTDDWEWVVIDWMAGSQSLKVAVQEVNRKGRVQWGDTWRVIHYVGLDSQEHVYSAGQRKWVQNVKVDLMQIGEEELWGMVQDTVRGRRGQKGKQLRVLLMGESPCCKTFSKTDSVNIGRGENYRLHGPGNTDRPPKDRDSEKGKAAVQADRMVRKGQRVAEWVHRKGAAFYMENPVGSLQFRPYQVQWEQKGYVWRRVVHYCAFGHMYHKPTHIWTNMGQWAPVGETGNGRCTVEGRCRTGRWSTAGKWEHRFKMAQASQQAQSGKGRKARKMMMPKGLQVELIQSAIAMQTK